MQQSGGEHHGEQQRVAPNLKNKDTKWLKAIKRLFLTTGDAPKIVQAVYTTTYRPKIKKNKKISKKAN